MEKVGIWLCVSDVWVSVEALTLDWKGRRGWDTVVHVRIHRSWCGWWPCVLVRGAGVGGG